MFSKKELKIINNVLIIIYLLSVGPTFIFGFAKSSDFTSTFFLIANIILVCLFIIIAIRIAKINFRLKTQYCLLGIIILISIIELAYPGLTLNERISNYFAISNIIISLFIIKISKKLS
jgi:hypothetical protein